MYDIQRIREKIKSLNESEAKSLLMILYVGLDTLNTVINRNGGQEDLKEIAKDLINIYKEIPDNINNIANNSINRENSKNNKFICQIEK